jgi:hypothetical protein
LDARQAAEVASVLLDTIGKTSHHSALKALATAVANVAARLPARQAAKVCAAAASALVGRLPKAKDPADVESLAEALAELAERLDTRQAAKVASALLNRIHRTSDIKTLWSLAWALSNVAERLEAREVTKISSSLLAHVSRPTSALPHWVPAVVLCDVAHLLEPRQAQTVASLFVQSFEEIDANVTSDPDEDSEDDEHPTRETVHRSPDAVHSCAFVVQALGSLLTRVSRTESRSRISAAIAALGTASAPGAAVALPALLVPALRPLPKGLPAQDLVELLKHPLCVGDSRRAVLDALGARFGRTFADQWDFVRFARRKRPDLDLDSPPRRMVADEK